MNYKKARGYLSQDERDYLYQIAKKTDTIINVGIEYGASIVCFVEGANPQTKIIGIDLIGTNKFEGNIKCRTQHLDEYNIVTHLQNGIDLINDALLSSFGKLVLFIEGNSNTIPLTQTADVIFIDGGHTYECVKSDIEKYAPLATKYLLFHDYSDSPVHDGVKRALDDWQSKEFEVVNQVDTIRVYRRS